MVSIVKSETAHQDFGSPEKDIEVKFTLSAGESVTVNIEASHYLDSGYSQILIEDLRAILEQLGME